MVVGLGIDIASIARIERALERFGQRFAQRILSDAELVLLERRADRACFVAGRFAAKEAAFKALGGPPGVVWRNLRVDAEPGGAPVLVVASRAQIGLLEAAEAFDDFVLTPLDHEELRLRLLRLTGGAADPALEPIRFKELELDPATYQARLGSAPLDLTYMEYELLRFFAANPGRVWRREQLLSRVWGYDYFGGARTVDVHVRRLRA